MKGGARFSLSKRAVDVDWDAGRASHLPVPHHGRARRFEARGAIVGVLGQIWRPVLRGVGRVDAGEAMRGRCLLVGCQHLSRVRGVCGSRGTARVGFALSRACCCCGRVPTATGDVAALGYVSGVASSCRKREVPRFLLSLRGADCPEAAAGPVAALGSHASAIWTRRQCDVLAHEELVEPYSSHRGTYR